MTAIDTNILLELLVDTHPDHRASLKALGNNLNDEIGLTSVNIAETLRLLTHPKVFSPCLKMKHAVELINDFIEANQVHLLGESKTWWKDVGVFAAKEIPDLRGNEIFDAQIASCLKYNGARKIWTRDSDFQKFTFLQVIHEL